MHNTIQAQDIALNSEIKALLILLLLKGGTRSEEIEIALRLANGEKVKAKPSVEERRACPLARADVQAMTPKQRIRNGYLAPLKCYAA